jgi:TolA-binding protein
MSQDGSGENGWHLDKRVPIALIFSILCVGVGGWVKITQQQAQTDERLFQIERRLEGFSQRSASLQSVVNEQGQTIAVLLSRIDDTNRNLDRLRGEVQITNNLLRELLTDQRSTED